MPVIREYETLLGTKKPGLVTSESFRLLSEEELEERHNEARRERARRFRWGYGLIGLKVVAHKDGTLEASWTVGDRVLSTVNNLERSL